MRELFYIFTIKKHSLKWCILALVISIVGILLAVLELIGITESNNPSHFLYFILSVSSFIFLFTIAILLMYFSSIKSKNTD